MEIKIRLIGGPMHNKAALTDRLDPLKVFFDDREKIVLVYAKENEIEYVYDFLKSKALSQNYEQARERILGLPPASLRFSMENKTIFSDKPIEE